MCVLKKYCCIFEGFESRTTCIVRIRHIFLCFLSTNSDVEIFRTSSASVWNTNESIHPSTDHDNRIFAYSTLIDDLEVVMILLTLKTHVLLEASVRRWICHLQFSYKPFSLFWRQRESHAVNCKSRPRLCCSSLKRWRFDGVPSSTLGGSLPMNVTSSLVDCRSIRKTCRTFVSSWNRTYGVPLSGKCWRCKPRLPRSRSRNPLEHPDTGFPTTVTNSLGAREQLFHGLLRTRSLHSWFRKNHSDPNFWHPTMLRWRLSDQHWFAMILAEASASEVQSLHRIGSSCSRSRSLPHSFRLKRPQDQYETHALISRVHLPTRGPANWGPPHGSRSCLPTPSTPCTFTHSRPRFPPDRRPPPGEQCWPSSFTFSPCCSASTSLSCPSLLPSRLHLSRAPSLPHELLWLSLSQSQVLSAPPLCPSAHPSYHSLTPCLPTPHMLCVRLPFSASWQLLSGLVLHPHESEVSTQTLSPSSTAPLPTSRLYGTCSTRLSSEVLQLALHWPLLCGAWSSVSVGVPVNLPKSSVSQMVCFLSSLHHKNNHLVGTSSSKKKAEERRRSKAGLLQTAARGCEWCPQG